MITKNMEETNFRRFTNGPVYFFRFIGIDYKSKQGLLPRLMQWVTVTNIFVLTLHQVAFVVWSDGTFTEHAATVSYINYFCVGLGKLLSMIYNRRMLSQNHDNLRQISPSLVEQHEYNLEGYLKTYCYVEIFLWNFFKYICIFYLSFPVAFSCYEWWRDGQFSYRMPLPFWYPTPLEESVVEYIIYFVLQCHASFMIGVTILSCDLCLFSSVSILCSNFDMMAKQILQLQPEKPQSLNQMKGIIQHHQHILKLAGDINQIFTPSIIFSLLSSSFIICFIAYQMLDDVPVIFIVKALALLLYETKQVIITCYFGNKLMETSSNLFDVVYMHNWCDGSMEYKRLVLFMMMRMRDGTALDVAGIADVSLITLKQVFSMSYQTFAVLKTV